MGEFSLLSKLLRPLVFSGVIGAAGAIFMLEADVKPLTLDFIPFKC